MNLVHNPKVARQLVWDVIKRKPVNNVLLTILSEAQVVPRIVARATDHCGSCRESFAKQ